MIRASQLTCFKRFVTKTIVLNIFFDQHY